MNYGAVVFLVGFLALASSWCGMVLAPQLQVGRQELATNSVTSLLYPSRRPGLAEQGAQVYRANGCVACHSQNVRQAGTVLDVILAEAGTNTSAVLQALTNIAPTLKPKFLAALPANVLTAVGRRESDDASKALKEAGAKAEVLLRGTVFDVVLADAGTNTAAVLQALTNIAPTLNPKFLAALPANVLTAVGKSESESASKALNDAGTKAEVRVRPIGTDIERGWGLRGNVAQDYLQDAPVLTGSQRLGPDLANIGARNSDLRWHLEHLYDPKSKVPDSTMPPYRFLFEKRRIGRNPSPDRLNVATEPGYEVVPTDKAVALAAYLQSLRSDAPLFEAPFSAPAAPKSDSPAK